MPALTNLITYIHTHTHTHIIHIHTYIHAYIHTYTHLSQCLVQHWEDFMRCSLHGMERNTTQTWHVPELIALGSCGDGESNKVEWVALILHPTLSKASTKYATRGACLTNQTLPSNSYHDLKLTLTRPPVAGLTCSSIFAVELLRGTIVLNTRAEMNKPPMTSATNSSLEHTHTKFNFSLWACVCVCVCLDVCMYSCVC